MSWPDGARGVLELPDGTRVRGRGLHGGAASDDPPDWALLLLEPDPEGIAWPVRRIEWPDFGLPADAADARAAFEEAHARAKAGERVEVGCAGGIGRTGTALACIACLAGVPADEAVAFVRDGYLRHAVETPQQEQWVREFCAGS